MISLLSRSNTPLKSAHAAQDVVLNCYAAAGTLTGIASDPGVA